jgi:ADP-heptose:LPS heptosyltransferase
MSLTPATLKIDTPIRILVDRRKAVGDVVMITPVLRELRNRYGADAFIQVVTEETIVLANNPHINRVVKPADMKREDPWDLYINLNDAYESNVTAHYVDAYLYRAFGTTEGIDRSLVVEASAEEKENVKEAQADINGPYVVFHMRRWAWENKNINLETWTVLMTWIEAAFPKVKMISVGAQYDFKMPLTDQSRYISLNEQLSIGELKELIAGAEFFIGGDSGPYHIACATDTPIIALLSHLSPSQILPWRSGEFGKDVHVAMSKVPCTGCYARQKPPVRNLTCENPVEWACANMFDIPEITEIMAQLLKEHA